ncbi:MAG: acetyl-CoA carboxylase, carboxyltransferase subunit beta [Fusobacteriaceae bacterium]
MSFFHIKKKYVTLTVRDKTAEKKSDIDTNTNKINENAANQKFVEKRPIDSINYPIPPQKTKSVNEGISDAESTLWIKCPSCKETLYKVDLEKSLKTCSHCGYIFPLLPGERISLLIDEGTFKEYDSTLASVNPLKFPQYDEKYKSAVKKTCLNDGVVSGVGNLNGITVSIAVMDFNFMGGSMGSVVGEKITRAFERGAELKIPVIVVSSSGGARMHEGIISLMQMAKTSAAIEKLRTKGIPYISIPVDPTTGGVTASFAMLGDINLTEPNALIAFAGPRVIEQTIKQKLPEGFQRSEFLQEHGMIDVITKRPEMKNTLYKILSCTV